MSKKPAVIKIYYDYDYTLTHKDSDPVEFNGSPKVNDPGIWISCLAGLAQKYAGKIVFEIDVLTSRRLPNLRFLNAGRLLNFKLIDKISGKEIEDKSNNISIAIHYPNDYPKKIIFKNSMEIKETYPHLVWENSQNKLIYYSEANHKVEFYPSDPQKKVIEKLAQNYQDKVLDWNIDRELCEAISKCVKKDSRVMTYAPDGKKLFESKWQESSFRPAFHFTPVIPKAVIMNAHRQEAKTYGNVLASILIDDQPHVHEPHLKEFDHLYIIGCPNLKGFSYNSPAMINEVNNIFKTLKDTISKIYDSYENYQSSLLTLSSRFVTSSAPEFNYKNYHYVYKKTIKKNKYSNLTTNPIALKCYSDIMLFLRNYCRLSQKLKLIEEEKPQFQPLLNLMPILKLAETEICSANDGGKFFISYPLSRHAIVEFLHGSQHESNDLQQLIADISVDLESKSFYCSPKYIVYLLAIIKLHEISIKNLPAFDLAVNGVIDIFTRTFSAPTSVPKKSEDNQTMSFISQSH